MRFEAGTCAAQYDAVAKRSKVTAPRHLAVLVEKDYGSV
jgi:hypothetical protein